LDSAEELLRNEYADFYIPRREQDDNRLRSIDPIARTVERVRDESRLLGELFFLGKIPLGPLQGGLLGEEVLLGGADLVGTGAKLGGDESGLELGNALFALISRGAGEVEVALRGDICSEEFFLPIEFDVSKSEGGAYFAELGFEGLDFARALAGLGIFQLGAGLLHAALRLVKGGLLGSFLQSKKQRPFFNFLAALDGEVFQAPAEGRRNMDEFALDVALHKRGIIFFARHAKERGERKKSGGEKFHAAILSGRSTGRKRKLAWYFPPLCLRQHLIQAAVWRRGFTRAITVEHSGQA
jgi:hypothetical protein